jgi:hypothetical protein
VCALPSRAVQSVEGYRCTGYPVGEELDLFLYSLTW